MQYYQRNLIVLSSTVFLAALSWHQVMPFIPLYLKELGISDSAALVRWSGFVAAAHPVAALVAQPLWGKIGDKFGLKPMVIRAGISLSIIYASMSFCTAPWQLLALRFCNGALAGFIPGSYALIATNTPQKLAPRSVANAQAAAAAGMIAGPAIGGLLAVALGFRGSIRISAAALLLSTILVSLLVEQRHRPTPATDTSILEDLKLPLQMPALAAVMATGMMLGTFASSVNALLPIHLNELQRGIAPVISGLIISLPGIAFVLTAGLWTKLGERKGYNHAIFIGMAGVCLSALLLFFMNIISYFAMLYLLAGIFLASINPSMSAIICTRIDEGYRGRAYGLQQSANMLGGMSAPVAAGFLCSTFGIRYVFLMVSAIFLCGAILSHKMFERCSGMAANEVSRVEGKPDLVP